MTCQFVPARPQGMHASTRFGEGCTAYGSVHIVTAHAEAERDRRPSNRDLILSIFSHQQQILSLTARSKPGQHEWTSRSAEDWTGQVRSHTIWLSRTVADLPACSFFKSEEFSDLTVTCGPCHFKVHKVIVCSQSQYFRTACQAGRFKVRSILCSLSWRDASLTAIQEGSTGVIELKAVDETSSADDACDEPELVKLMMKYFYHCDYDAKGTRALPEVLAEVDTIAQEEELWTFNSQATRKKKKRRDTRSQDKAPVQAESELFSFGDHGEVSAELVEVLDEMTVHAKLFALAVKYHVDALRDLATEKFREAVETGWDTEAFAPAAHIVFTSTAEDVRQLRDIVIATIQAHIGLLDNEAVQTVVKSINELAYEVLLKSRGILTSTASNLSTCCAMPLKPEYCHYCCSYSNKCKNNCQATCHICRHRL